MRRAILKSFLLLAPLSASASEVSLYYLNNLAVQYEGTGYRQSPGSWELKAKPKGGGQGLRWRGGSFEAQFWRNNPYFSPDTGNGGQVGRNRMAVNAILATVHLPLAASSAELVGGLSVVHADMDRKDVFFNGAMDNAGARERLSAVGPVIGFHGRAGVPRNDAWTWWADGEVLAGRFLWTRNRLRVDGSSLSRGGFSYLFRGEVGLRRGSWRFGAGVVRQMHEILVPGGQTLSNGGAVSLPINKIDFESPFLSVSYGF